MYLSTHDNFSKLKALKTAWQKGKDFIEKLEYGRLISPTREAEYSSSRDKFSEIPVILEETKQLNFYNVQIRKGRKIVAHVSCNYSNEKIQIQDLYVLKKYRKKGLGDVLLSKVFEYAAEKKAQTIVAYCGPEPFCEDAQIPLEEEIDFYEITENGIRYDVDYVTAEGHAKTYEIISRSRNLSTLEELQNRSGSADYRNARGVMRETFVKVVNDDVTPVLKDVRCPVLLVWGSEDTAAPLWMGQMMEKEMPDAGLAVFEGDDHFAYWHQPDRFNRVLDIFLKEDKTC